MAGQGPSALRRANTSAVLDELRLVGRSSRADIARRTGLAKQTVSTIVASLLADGVVREVGRRLSEAEGGRPATLVEYAADRRLVAGVELGVGRTRVVVADAVGQPLAERDVVVAPPARSPDRVVDAVVAAMTSASAAVGGTHLLRAVGVSVTGLVRPSTGHCVLAPNLGWRDVPVRSLLSARLGAMGLDTPVVVRGAAQASLIAEHREGAAAEATHAVLLFEDEGIGAAVVENGRLLDGSDGTAGELGHCAWPGAASPCGCGKRGCVETLASGPAVLRAAERALGSALALPAGVPTLEALARLPHDEVAAACAEAGGVLGTAASWLVALTAPDLVVLSGSLVDAPAPYRASLRACLDAHPPPSHRPSVVSGALAHDAAFRGAVLLAVDEARRVNPLDAL